MALTSIHYGQVVEKPDAALEKDWQEFVLVMRKDGNVTPFFKKQNPERIQAWKEAADRGAAHGQVLFGFCLLQGIGGDKDDAKAMTLIEKAANGGDAMAMVCMSIHCFKKNDSKSALDWLRRSAGTGYPAAMAFLGTYYLESEGPNQDDVQAVQWFRKGAEGDDLYCMERLAWMLLTGRGGKADDTEAVRWLQKASGAGFTPAMFRMGWRCENGTGVAMNLSEAVKWYRKAADLGDIEAMKAMSLCYGLGRGVTVDLAEAVKWRKKADELEAKEKGTIIPAGK